MSMDQFRNNQVGNMNLFSINTSFKLDIARNNEVPLVKHISSAGMVVYYNFLFYKYFKTSLTLELSTRESFKNFIK